MCNSFCIDLTFKSTKKMEQSYAFNKSDDLTTPIEFFTSNIIIHETTHVTTFNARARNPI